MRVIHDLTTTRDPELLVPGSLEALHTDADELEATARTIAQAAREVSRQEIPGWLGGAAAGWADRRVLIDRSLSAVVDIFTVAAQAFRAHAEVLAWARGEAGTAVDRWAQEQDILTCSAGTLPRGVDGVGFGPAGVSLAPQPAFNRGVDDGTRSQAQQILAHAVEQVRLSARATAEALDLLSEDLPDGRWHHDQWFAALGEWAVRMLPVVQAVRTVVDYDGVSAESEEQGEAIRAAVEAIATNPDQTVPILFDTQTLEDNPARWWGAAAPDLVLSAAGGAGVASRALSVLRAPRTLRTFTSKDPLVADIANMIERERPGWIGRVNFNIDQLNNGYREIDIEVGNVLVQVKSGPAGGLTGQVAKTTAMTGRTTVGYAPEMTQGAYANALRTGVPVARTPEELMAILRELQ